MALENKLNITHQIDLVKTEEKKSVSNKPSSFLILVILLR